jgi:uncharacterized membrane protein
MGWCAVNVSMRIDRLRNQHALHLLSSALCVESMMRHFLPSSRAPTCLASRVPMGAAAGALIACTGLAQ